MFQLQAAREVLTYWNVGEKTLSSEMSNVISQLINYLPQAALLVFGIWRSES